MKLMTIDGNSIINRAFYGIRMLTAGDGTPTNAVYGFLMILQKLIADESPDALCVTFDLAAPTFRHKMYDGYKAQRKGMPDELALQMPILKEILDAMNIPRYELEGWEADDILGAISRKCETDGWECVIVTGDKDALQLLTESTSVRHVKTAKGQTTTKRYTPAVFEEEYGFPPMNLIDLKALMGDSSDNIPGVAGVGEKTALELVRSIGGIEKIYASLDLPDIKDAVKKKLSAGRDNADMSYELALIRTDAPIELDLNESLCSAPNNDKLYEVFIRLGFASFITKYGLTPPDGSQDIIRGPRVINITSTEESAGLLAAARNAGQIALALDIENFGYAAVAIPGEQTAYSLRDGMSDNFEIVVAGLLSDDIKKAGHDVKDIMRACRERGFETGGWVFDTALAAYLISPTDSNYDISRISARYCGYDPTADTDDAASGQTTGQTTLSAWTDRPIAEESYAIGLLISVLSEKLREAELGGLLHDMELPLCTVLADMEHTGFLVDRGALIDFGRTLAGRIGELEIQIYSQAGESFNISSPKQLGEVLFNRLMLPPPKKTKTGYSTNADVLDSLEGKHPIIALIKDYRELTKLKSTYADGLLRVIKPDGRIHTRFMMTVTATGRLSSVEPNMQNIPVRRDLGGELRKMFVANEGCLLVDADYSQIELRLLAHIANDTIMREAFEKGEDIHTVTASQVFGVPLSDVTSIMRTRAKAVNFGIVYGISAYSLGLDIGVATWEAKEYIDNYLEKYAGVRAYMSRIVEMAKESGYVTTLYGRRRYLPELKSSNANIRSFGERVALNMPIQGTAADIMKIAMINAWKRLKRETPMAKLILQVHDELIVECPESEVNAVGLVLREEMENAAELTVPLVAETRSGKTWHDAKLLI